VVLVAISTAPVRAQDATASNPEHAEADAIRGAATADPPTTWCAVVFPDGYNKE
jgi:hypothetical protein